jgi:hypothetical protein
MISEELVRIAHKKSSDLTPKEESDLYWWFYTEMETPTEQNLLYFCYKYALPNKRKWFMLLVENFPTRENMMRLEKYFGFVGRGRQEYTKALKNLINRNKSSTALLALVADGGGKRTRAKARKLLEKIRQNWSDYQI